jgi:hypothetical protein
MSDDQLSQAVSKLQTLSDLHRARERVKQLERELRGEPRKPERPIYVPEFLRPEAAGGIGKPHQ